MDDFLNKLKTRTENLELLNQKEVDEDILWANIKDEITEKEEPRKKRGFLFFLPFLLLLLFCVGGIGLYFSENMGGGIEKKDRNIVDENSIVDMQNNESTLTETNIEKTSGLETEEKNAETEKVIKESITKLPQKNKESNYKSSIQDKVIIPTNITTSPIVTDEAIIELSLGLKEPDYKTIYDDNVVINESTKDLSISEESNSSIAEKQNIGGKTENGSLLIPDMVNANKLLVISPSIISRIEENRIIESIGLSKNNTFPPKKRMNISLGLFSGSHLLHSNFRSTTSESQERKELLNSGFKPKLGYSLSAEVMLNLTKKITLTSGVEYIYSIEQFNYMTSWDTTFQSIQNPNIIINQTSERTVRHHNRHSSFSIPILLGTQIRKGRFELGANLGVGLNFTQSQKGKTLGSNLEVVEYPISDNNNLSIRPNFSLSYHLCPYLNYQLDKNLKFQLRANFKYQNYGFTDFYKEMKFSSVLTGLQVGIIMDILK